MSQHSAQMEFVNQTTVTFAHNLDCEQVSIRFVDADGETHMSAIDSASADLVDPRNVVIVLFSAPESGRLQAVEPDFFCIK